MAIIVQSHHLKILLEVLLLVQIWVSCDIVMYMYNYCILIITLTFSAYFLYFGQTINYSKEYIHCNKRNYIKLI